MWDKGPSVLPWVFEKTENVGFTGNLYHVLLCLWFRLHFPTNFTPGVKTVVRKHFCLITLITPIPSCKAFQPAALQTHWYLCAVSPQHSAVSWKAAADQKITAASGGATGGILQPLTRSLSRPKIMIQPWVMGICSHNGCTSPADIAAGQSSGLGDDRNDEKKMVENGLTVEVPPQRNLKHFQCFMS